MLEPTRFLDILKHFILFWQDTPEDKKISPDITSIFCCAQSGGIHNSWENPLTGKAMIVAYSRPIAMDIYHKILEFRPGWTEKIKVVMTSGNNEPEK